MQIKGLRREQPTEKVGDNGAQNGGVCWRQAGEAEKQRRRVAIEDEALDNQSDYVDFAVDLLSSADGIERDSGASCSEGLAVLLLAGIGRLGCSVASSEAFASKE